MAHPKPLQPADRAPNYSSTDSSTAADRRPDRVSSVHSLGEHESDGQPDQAAFRPGQLAPSGFLRAPWTVETHEYNEDQIHEIDILKYGDCFDPQSPMRVRVVDWTMDTDEDGHPN